MTDNKEDTKEDLKEYYTAGLPLVHLMMLLATLGIVATAALYYFGL
jgi:hypothetical protein